MNIDTVNPIGLLVYARVYAYAGHFECGRGCNTFDPQKCTVFPAVTKVGPIWPTFIRGDPYEPHRPSEKVTFSDH